MDIMIYTSDPDKVDPAEIADALSKANYLVLSVNVNDGERTWEMGEQDEEESVRGCSCGMADYGAPGHDGDPSTPHEHGEEN